MKKFFLFLFPTFLFLIFFGACKKENQSDPPENNGYRVISVKKTWVNTGYYEEETYSYLGDRISQQLIDINNIQSESTDYTYQDDKVITETKILKNSELTHTDSSVYLFEAGKLVNLLSWKKTDSIWSAVNITEFLYEGDLITEYNDTIINVSRDRGSYEYGNGILNEYSWYTYHEWTNAWQIRNRKQLYYIDGKLSEQIVSSGEADTKYVYHYENGRLSQLDIYTHPPLDWELLYQSFYSYDQFGNLIRDEQKNAYDQSLHYVFEYQYEEGKNNVGTILYKGWQYPGMKYPELN